MGASSGKGRFHIGLALKATLGYVLYNSYIIIMTYIRYAQRVIPRITSYPSKQSINITYCINIPDACLQSVTDDDDNINDIL